MDKAKAIKTKPGYINVMYEVLPLQGKSVIGVPVSADRQDFARTPFDGDDIGLSNVILVINSFNDQICMDFVNSKPLVIVE